MGLLDRDARLELLHPLMRDAVEKTLAECAARKLPLRLFEGYRTPERQAALYAQGRTVTGKIVTNAQAWESYHQYGLAVDLVGFVKDQWTWDLPDKVWMAMHEIGARHGLEHLSWETPHLQLANLTIAHLMQGGWPSAQDPVWHNNLAEAAARWHGSPPAPPVALVVPDGEIRPALAASSVNWKDTPAPNISDWHNMFGGQEWRNDGMGIYLRDAPDQALRTPGAPITVSAIIDLYGAAIHDASIRYGIPPEIIIMTIGTEAGVYRKQNFTGPATFRWEAHVLVTDVSPQTRGDYSAGPMQTLATTAREVIRTSGLPYDPFVAAPYLRAEPAPRPAENPLYDGKINIDIGTAEIKHRITKTGLDPVLVAAAYNAGGLYQTDANEWHLHCSGDHLDRAAQWFGDACFVLAPLRR